MIYGNLQDQADPDDIVEDDQVGEYNAEVYECFDWDCFYKALFTLHVIVSMLFKQV